MRIMSRGQKTSRFLLRLWILLLAVIRQQFPRSRQFPADPRKILILHSLLLGDTLLLTPLLAKLREQYPSTDIKLTIPNPLFALYETHPYGVKPIPFHPKRTKDILNILRSGPYDLVIIPAENRFSLLARACGSRHTVAFDNDRPSWKNKMVDTKVQLPQQAMAIGDIFSTLIPGKPPSQFNPASWPRPAGKEQIFLENNTIIMHITASMQTKMWPFSKWLELAKRLKEDGYSPYWSIAPGEEATLSTADPNSLFPHIALKFPQMWLALESSVLLISVDTSIVHLARITQTPTVALYGPTDPDLFGAGRFWINTISTAIFLPEVTCRDDHHFFRRPLPWVNICTRDSDRCGNSGFINDISVNNTYNACTKLLTKREPPQQ